MVRILATMAFAFLFLLPIISLSATRTEAGETVQSAASHSGDYVFFIVQNEEVPLAAAPSFDNVSSYILWIALASFVLTIAFVYSTWYLSVRKNICELTGKLSPAARRSFRMASGFFHPIRSYRLAKEAEDTVASMYFNYN